VFAYTAASGSEALWTGKSMRDDDMRESERRAFAPFLNTLLAVVAICLASTARGDCGCFCVDGERRTLCSGIGEAGDDPNLCPPLEPGACPMDPDAGTGTSYEAPAPNAVNCRDVRVYDPSRGQYVSVRACDVI
jgi:hypothetical protein